MAAPLTVREIIKAALRVAQALRKGEEPDDEEMADALEAMSIMLRSWSARRLMVRATVQEQFSLTAGTYIYTIGVGGDFNTTKPFNITSAFLRDSNNIDTIVTVIPRELYDAYQDKVVSTSRPESLLYDPGVAQQDPQLGTIYLYNIPDSYLAYTLFINSVKPFTEITSINDGLTFDLPYEEAIKYELAIRMWREYHDKNVPVPQDVFILAKEAMHTVQNMNSVTYIAAIDTPGSKNDRSYNIYTGDYNP